MPGIHLRQSGFRYCGYESVTKNKEIMQKGKEKEHSIYLYQNWQEKLWLQHDMPYGDF